MARDQYKNTETSPANGFETAQQDVDYDPRPKALYVGQTGTVVLRNPNGQDVTFTNMQGGNYYPIRFVRIVGVGTTALGLNVLL